MDFKEKVEVKLKSYSGSEIVSEWQKTAYKQGIADFAEELTKRFNEESKNGNELTRAGLWRAIGIIKEYGS